MRSENRIARSSAAILLLVSLLPGCALLPYESEFMCSATDDYGRCTDVAGAYAEARNGVLPACSGDDAAAGLCPLLEPAAPSPIDRVPAPAQGDSAATPIAVAHAGPRSPHRAAERPPIAGAPPRVGNPPTRPDGPELAYRQQSYRELAALIEQPVTPIVRPPKVLRTLVIAYSAGETLFMPRYLYYFAAEPEFVLGEQTNPPGSGRGQLFPSGH